MEDSDTHDRLAVEPVTDDDLLFVDDDHFSADSVAIVTGAGSGIGQATALALAANGLTVAATDVTKRGSQRR